MKTLENGIKYNDDDDVKIVLSSPESSTSHQLLDSSGNKIGEVELNTYDNFAYATESFTTIDRIAWGEEDTNLLLEKYELYIPQVGPRKRFQSKKHMWNQIANDIYAKFKLIITGVQCENRYKTVCKRKKQCSDNNSRLNNSKTSVATEEQKGIPTDNFVEPEIRNEAIQANIEKLEQKNQELSQQIEQNNVRFITVIEKLEKQHIRQQQKLERTIQETKEQIKTEFTMLLEKLDNIHNRIQQNQDQQQQILDKLIKGNQEGHQTNFATLVNILEKINKSVEATKKPDDCVCEMRTKSEDEMRRSKSRSRSGRRSSRALSPHSPPRKRHHSPTTRSPSNSKCHHDSPSSARTSKRSRSNDKYRSGSHSSKTKTSQHPSHSGRPSKYHGRYKSKSRSPKQSTHRCCLDSSCKQHEKYR